MVTEIQAGQIWECLALNATSQKIGKGLVEIVLTIMTPEGEKEVLLEQGVFAKRFCRYGEEGAFISRLMIEELDLRSVWVSFNGSFQQALANKVLLEILLNYQCQPPLL
jgi:hypothetical protein